MQSSSSIHYILVMSGKGGVGKSTISSNLARVIAKEKGKCGILDLDLCGPSLPTIFGITDAQIRSTPDKKMIPATSNGVEIMSLGFLNTSKESAVIWRGPKKNSFINQIFNNVAWTSSIIVVDLPPGTSDEHFSIFEMLKQSGSSFSTLLITTPSPLAIADVKKEISFIKEEKAERSICGIVENFAGVMCPCCGEVSPLVEEKCVKDLSEEEGIPILSKIPFSPIAAMNFDKGEANEQFFNYFAPIVKLFFHK